ncbi:hypothetical protein [Bradyrhizobium sp. AZCC 1693]|uniref:hypothetical protein n=1 Tax=Bradyrhizobium sp. AZCC 1693 TaxID=3117029 RepID=UPI002FF3B790
MKRGRPQSAIEIQLSHLGGADPPTYRLSIQLPQKRERIAQLLKLFSSARRRPGLTPDEVLVFFAMGYLSLSVSNDVILMRSVRLVDVAASLGMAQETVRRKAMRLADVEYVSITRDGILIKRFDMWCQMFERALI